MQSVVKTKGEKIKLREVDTEVKKDQDGGKERRFPIGRSLPNDEDQNGEKEAGNECERCRRIEELVDNKHDKNPSSSPVCS